MRKKSVLLAANFSNNTGYAWKHIYKLYNAIARSMYEKDMSICLSFANISHPITILDCDIPFHAFIFNPRSRNLKGLLYLRKEIRQQNIRYVYFTDLGSWCWLYAILRLWGVRKIVVHKRVVGINPEPAYENGVKRLVKIVLNNVRLLSTDSMYVISDFVRNYVIRKACYPSDRITKIHDGIDVDSFNCHFCLLSFHEI